MFSESEIIFSDGLCTTLFPFALFLFMLALTQGGRVVLPLNQGTGLVVETCPDTLEEFLDGRRCSIRNFPHASLFVVETSQFFQLFLAVFLGELEAEDDASNQQDDVAQQEAQSCHAGPRCFLHVEVEEPGQRCIGEHHVEHAE